MAALPLALALAGCAAPAPRFAAVAGPLRVPGGGYADGAVARKQAETVCAARGLRLRPSIYDRFDAGGWVFEGGCA
jgi:hypothetical protein